MEEVFQDLVELELLKEVLVLEVVEEFLLSMDKSSEIMLNPFSL